MRRATVLAILLAVALSGVAQAAGHAAKATGDFTLTRGWFDEPGVLNTHSVTLSALTNPTRGNYTFASSDGVWFSGPVTCVVITGTDAWVAGPATAGSEPGMEMFFWIHDGGKPSLDRVVAVVENLDVGVPECQTMNRDYPLFRLDTGNANVSGG